MPSFRVLVGLGGAAQLDADALEGLLDLDPARVELAEVAVKAPDAWLSQLPLTTARPAEQGVQLVGDGSSGVDAVVRRGRGRPRW